MSLRNVGLLLLAASLGAQAGSRYQPAWESLETHPNPVWFDDAKFGIYFHWGPYSVPAFDNEWYSRNMYRPGHRAQQHHLAVFGTLDKFGYKDFIPLFNAIVMGQPKGQVIIRSLAAGIAPEKISRIEMLGVKKPLKSTRNAQGLAVQIPAALPCDYAVVLKLVP